MTYVSFDTRLVKAVSELSYAKDVQDVMSIVKSVVRQYSGADGVTFVLRDGDKCHYADEDAIGPLWKGQRFPLESCISGWVMLNKTTAVIEDIYKDARIPADAYRPTFVKSLAMAPVRRDKPIAAIGAYWASTYLPTAEEVSQLETLADCAAISIANVQLRADLQRCADSEREARLLAEQASRAKDEFLAVVSHELRTPLTPLLGWVNLLSAHSPVPELENGLKVMKRSVELQRRVVEDLLDFSGIITGKMRVHLNPIPWASPIVDALESFMPLAETKRVKLNLDLDSSIIVNGDCERLQQVAWNVIGNALKFSHPNSEVTVSLRHAGANAEFSVQDAGVGIAPEFLPNLFQRFTQYDGRSTRRAGGLGLGLSIVRHIMEMHGGTVKAESEGLSRGAKFTFTLPMLS
jgi:signal transduction histidine kinase